MIEIREPKFMTSAASSAQFVKSDKPIIAVCGKSNVGKSSFINMMANRNKLAKVSQEPGRTRLINYFDFGDFILADLPGYGFARVSKTEKERWAKLLDEFFEQKQNICHVLALCDIRHEPTANDIQMVEYLYYHLIGFTLVATKADKLSRQQIGQHVRMIATCYKCGEKDILPVSAVSRLGYQEVITKLDRIITATKEQEEHTEDE